MRMIFSTAIDKNHLSFPTPIYFNFSKCFWIFKGKNTLFSKSAKKWSSCQKNGYHFFFWGGVRAQSDKNHFFF